MNVERVLRNTAATVSVTFYNGSTAVEADGAVTVVAKRADGTTLLSTTATNDPAVGVYTLVIPSQASLNFFTLTWSGTFTGTAISIESYVEIVGGFYFSIAELRASDSALTVSRFPNQALIDSRLSVENEFEDICGQAFVPRFASEWVTDSYDYEIYTSEYNPRKLTAMKVNGTSYDLTNWETLGYVKKRDSNRHGFLLSGPALPAVYTGNDVYIEYEYGMPQVPYPIKEKALRRAKLNLLGMASTIDPRATTMILPDIGSVNLATPGMRGLETGIPDIDVVLRRYTVATGNGGGMVY